MKNLLLTIFISTSFGAISQKESPTLQNLQKNYSYQKSKTFTGPENSAYESPAEIKSDYSEYNSSSNSSGNNSSKKYSSQQIQKQRSGKNGAQNSSGKNGEGNGTGGNKPLDPEMGKPKPIDFETPDFETPDLDLPDVEPPSASGGFWKVILIVILGIALLFVVYYIVKNYKPKNKKIISKVTQDDWNPTIITKTELEKRLEEAISQGNFRECVRIYFTFILKEMIRLNRIKWKKEFTNYDYVLQVKAHKNPADFEESVRIYDLVWYGEYEINRTDYDKLAIHLHKNYKDLENA